MLIFGSGSDFIPLQDRGMQSCSACGHQSRFSLVLVYRYFHLYWIMGVVTSETYAFRCDQCGTGWNVPTAKAREIYPNDLIPFHERYGLAIGGGALLALMMLVLVW